MPPTDRSMLPEIISRVNAPPTIIAGTACRRMLMMFGTPMNFGDIIVNMRMITASTPITYRLLTAVFSENLRRARCSSVRS